MLLEDYGSNRCRIIYVFVMVVFIVILISSWFIISIAGTMCSLNGDINSSECYTAHVAFNVYRKLLTFNL